MTQREDTPDRDEAERESPGFRVSDRRWWVEQEEAEAAAAEPAPVAEAKPSYVEELERKLAATDQQLQDTLRQYRAAREEFERARGRIERESERERARARLDFLRGFLPVLDDLERAAGAAETTSDAASLRDGIELVQRRFLGTLRDHGVLRMSPKGEPFDPRHHEALTIVPVADAAQDGHVVDVVEPGYAAGDEVLRAARVTVGKYSGE